MYIFALFDQMWVITKILIPRAYYDYSMYSIMFHHPHETDYNYVFNLAIRPFCATCTIVPIYCYVAIFVMTYRSRQSIQSMDKELAIKRKKEVFRTLQFAFVFCFYIGKMECDKGISITKGLFRVCSASSCK
jgi:hypothetical protein